MVWIIALITLYLCHHHLRIQDSILTETFIDTRPTWVATQIHHRIINPRTVCCTTLISRNLCSDKCEVGIKRSTQVDWLWEECSSLSIRNTVVVVETIDIRDSDILHRLLLNQLYPFLPLVNAWGTSTWGIENRAHLPLRDKCVEHRLIKFPNSFGIT